jgi:TRAP-type transport system small permease protein
MPASSQTELRRPTPGGALHLLDVAVQKVLAAACVLLVAVMLATVGGQVVMRYLFNSPLSWSEEMARFAMVWMAFVSAALAFRKGQHIKLEGLRLYPERLGPAVLLFGKVVVVVMLTALVYFGWQLTMRTMTQHSPALGVSMALMYSSIPLSAACMLFFALHGWSRAGEQPPAAP